MESVRQGERETMNQYNVMLLMYCSKFPLQNIIQYQTAAVAAETHQETKQPTSSPPPIRSIRHPVPNATSPSILLTAAILNNGESGAAGFCFVLKSICTAT